MVYYLKGGKETVSLGLMERLLVTINRDWLVAQIEAIEGLSNREKITAGKCLGRFDHEAWSTEETAFLGSGNLTRVKQIATIALDYCTQQAPSDEVRAELARIRSWLDQTE